VQEWRDVSVIRRARVMFALRDSSAAPGELSVLVADEHGKVVSDAKGRGHPRLEVWSTPAASRPAQGESRAGLHRRGRVLVPPAAGGLRRDHPVQLPSWCPCGAPGRDRPPDTFILKPSERDPSASNFIAPPVRRRRAARGVFNVVHGDKVAVDAILAIPASPAVSFVGSPPIARYVHQRASEAGKRVQALAARRTTPWCCPTRTWIRRQPHHGAGYGSAGQRCMAISAVVAVGTRATPWSRS